MNLRKQLAVVLNRMVIVATVALVPAAAHAAVPGVASVEGALFSAGGGPAADGTYPITFSLYKDSTTTNPTWFEVVPGIGVKGGLYSYQLGTSKPLDAATVALLGATPYLGIKVDSDPELPRKPLSSVPFALRAATAEAVNCTACIGAVQLDPAALSPYAKTASLKAVATSGLYSDLTGGPDLSAYAKTASLKAVATSGLYSDLIGEPDFSAYAKLIDLAPYAKAADLAPYAKTADLSVYAKTADLSVYAKTASLKTVATTGAYADLTGKPVMAALGVSCGTGLVVKGIKADGTHECVVAMDPKSLPADGLAQISNNLISNQFTDSANGTPNLAIKDFFPPGVLDVIMFPDIGLAQKLTVNVDISNSAVANGIQLYLKDPLGTKYYLCGPTDDASGAKAKPCGAGSSFKTSYPTPTVPIVGDLTTWINKNPVGKWELQVIDTHFKDNLVDGQINSWSISLSTLSSKKVEVKGDILVDGAFIAPTTFNELVTFKNNWCPNSPTGDKSIVVEGICLAGVGGSKTWAQAAAFCSAKNADICSGAQSLILRRAGYLPWNPQSGPYYSWINSYSDNDSSYHSEATGNGSDDWGATNTAAVACCYNATPLRDTDVQVKTNVAHKGVRVVAIHDVVDAPFGYAAGYCARLNADMCSKSELVYLRTAGKITKYPYWANDGEDTEGQPEYGTSGNVAPYNDTPFQTGMGFACCGADRSTYACPAGSTNTGGVCWTKVNNSAVNWVTAANDCGANGSHICTVSQNATLRLNNVITASGSWSAGFNDCDGYCSGTYGNGSIANDITPSNTYGYACCL